MKFRKPFHALYHSPCSNPSLPKLNPAGLYKEGTWEPVDGCSDL